MSVQPNPVSEGTDAELMARVQDGDLDAFNALYERYGARSYRVARAICRDRGRAEEAVQEAFVALWKGRSGFRAHTGSVHAWLLTIVRHRAIDLARRDARHAVQDTAEARLDRRAAPDDVPAQVAAMVEADDLRTLLARLPDTQHEVIVLAFYGQLSHSEIAEQLHLPAGTVKGRMRLGLLKLRGGIEQRA